MNVGEELEYAEIGQTRSDTMKALRVVVVAAFISLCMTETREGMFPII